MYETASLIYKSALDLITRNYSLFVFVAIAVTLLETFAESLSLIPAITLYGFIALYSHRMVLLGENYGWNTLLGALKSEIKPAYAHFFLGYFLTNVFSALIIFGAIALLSETVTLDQPVILVALSLCISLPLVGIFLAFFGLVLPGAATGNPLSFGSSFRRARSQYKTTFVRLALGPGAFSLFAVLAALVLKYIFGNWILTNFAATFLGLMPTHLAAVVLSLTYLETQPDTQVPG